MEISEAIERHFAGAAAQTAKKEARSSLHLIIEPETGSVLYAGVGGKLLMEIGEVHLAKGKLRVLDIKGKDLLGKSPKEGTAQAKFPANEDDPSMSTMEVSKAVSAIGAYFAEGD